MNDSSSSIFKFKIVSLGDSGVGKSYFLDNYVTKTNGENKKCATIGVDFKSTRVSIDRADLNVHLTLYDVSGDLKFRDIAKSYLYDSQAYLLFYDVSNLDSFNNCKLWLNELNESYLSVNPSLNDLVQRDQLSNDESELRQRLLKDKLIKILVGYKWSTNKRQVKTRRAKRFAREHGFCLFYEFDESAGSSIDCKQMLYDVAMELLSNYFSYLSFHHSTSAFLDCMPVTTRGLMLPPLFMSIPALSTCSNVFYDCQTHLLNSNFISFHIINSKRKNLQSEKLSLLDILFDFDFY